MSIQLWSEEFIVNTNRSGNQNDPELAVLANGNIIVVWEDAGPFDDQIVYRMLDGGGDPFSTEVAVYTDVFTESVDLLSADPAVAAFEDGGFVVGFRENDAIVETFSSRYVFFDASETVTNTYLSEASIAPLRDVNLFTVGSSVAAVHRIADVNGADGAGALFESDGTPSLVTTSLLGNASDIEADLRGTQLGNGTLAGGDVVIVWDNETSNNVEFGLFNAITGDLIGAPVFVAPTFSESVYPVVTALETGGFVISYTAPGRPAPGNGLDLAYRIFDADGVPTGSEQLINSYTTGAQRAHDVVALAGGGFMAVWFDDDRDGIYARSFDSAGTALTGETLISTAVDASLGSDQIDAALLQDGRVAITWESDRMIGGESEDIALIIVDPRDGVIVGRTTAEGSDDVDDQLFGTAGADVISGLAGFDLLIGMEGHDTLNGNQGDDILAGEAGDDQLFGGQGNDTLIGGTGHDLLKGGSGVNFLGGDAGNDSYIVGQGNDIIFELAGEGSDTVFARDSYVLTSEAEVELLRTISNNRSENINLTGNELSQTIAGNRGDNVLNTGDGAADVMFGRQGDDTYRVYNVDDQVFENANEGIDRVRSSVDYRLSAGQEIEFLTTNSFSDITDLALRGNEFAQTIVGNAGHNLLTDGTGAGDTLVGGGGDDSLRIFNSETVVDEQRLGGIDRIFASVDYELNAGARVELVSTHSFRSTSDIDLTGNELNQRVLGNQGDNRLSGREGNDTLNGSGGEDVFVFDTAVVAGQQDRINDYTASEDQFELDASVFTALTAGGALAGSAFRANTTGLAFDANDHIIYETDTGFIYYDADGSGAGAGIVFAQIGTDLTLTASEFDIV